MVRICIEAGLRSLSRHVGRANTFLHHLALFTFVSAQAAFAAPQSLEEMAALCNEVASELAVQVCAGDVKCSIPEMKSFVVGTLGCDSIEHPVSWNGTCSEDTEPCGDEGGRPRTCCAKGWSCQSFGSNYWCAPSEEKSCPNAVRPDRTKFCGEEGEGKNICCREGEKCVKKNDGWLNPLPSYFVCEPTDESCAAPNTICGNDCCSETQTCETYGTVITMQKCSANACPDGEERCRGVIDGRENFICCPNGTCSPSDDGNANCVHG